MPLNSPKISSNFTFVVLFPKKRFLLSYSICHLITVIFFSDSSQSCCLLSLLTLVWICKFQSFRPYPFLLFYNRIPNKILPIVIEIQSLIDLTHLFWNLQPFFYFTGSNNSRIFVVLCAICNAQATFCSLTIMGYGSK